MGNQSSRSVSRPAREVRTLNKLKDDVVAANKLRERPSARSLASMGVGADFVATLRFRLLCSQRVSKKMLPVIWKFNRNVLVQVNFEGGHGTPANASRFTPLEFYTFLKCLQDIHHEASRLEEHTSRTAASSATSSAADVRQDSVDDNECALCMENRVDVVTTCAHAFCNACLSDWVNQNPDADATCPVCRTVLERENSGTFSLADSGEGTFVITSMAERLQGLLNKHAVKAEIMLEGSAPLSGGAAGTAQTSVVET